MMKFVGYLYNAPSHADASVSIDLGSRRERMDGGYATAKVCYATPDRIHHVEAFNNHLKTLKDAIDNDYPLIDMGSPSSKPFNNTFR